MNEFYTRNGWKGSKYDEYKYATVTEIAKAIRKDLKEAMPECKFSVTTEKASMCSEIHVALMEAPYRAYLTIEEVEEASHDESTWNNHDHFINKKAWVNHYYCSYNYNYDEYRETTQEEKNKWVEQSRPTTKEIAEIMKKADAIVNAYRFDDSDGMIDYFDTNFYYFNCKLGSWNKDYICNPERANKIKKTTKVETTRKQQTEETTAIIIEDKEIEITVAEDIDTRDNSEMTLVKVVTTLDKEDYQTVKAFMQEKGGYYSRFKHGFIFRNNTALMECIKPVDNTEGVQNEPQEIEISSDETVTETEEITGKKNDTSFDEIEPNEQQEEIEIKISFEDDKNLIEEQKQQIKQEIEEIIAKQSISFNDLTCVHTSWDYKLSCGIWVENIEWDNNLSVVTCSVYG